MRISKQMKQILTVLNASKKPMKLTPIIMQVKGLKPIRKKLETHTGEVIELPPYIQLELASALRGASLTWWMGGPEAEKAHAEAAKLYVSFGRSINRLVEHELVSAWADIIHYGLKGDNFRQRQYSYFITERGREYMVTN